MKAAILPGEAMFRLMDSHGLPFSFIEENLHERGGFFDVLGFVEAASKSKNFSSERIYKVLTNDPNTTPEVRRLCFHIVYAVYESMLPVEERAPDPFLPEGTTWYNERLHAASTPSEEES
jgi:hypothetical protein